jgi:hypothetical protein
MSAKRAPRRKRLPLHERPSFKLMPRDIEIIRAVNDYRALFQSQLEQLFERSSSTLQKRLWLLWEHEFLDRQFNTPPYTEVSGSTKI